MAFSKYFRRFRLLKQIDSIRKAVEQPPIYAQLIRNIQLLISDIYRTQVLSQPKYADKKAIRAFWIQSV